MTENKRFTFKDGYLFDDVKGTAFLTVGDCCELLNELHEENEQLKQQIQDMQIRFKRKYDYEFDEIVDELEWYND